jgi:type VI protein secretion system component Hcp
MKYLLFVLLAVGLVAFRPVAMSFQPVAMPFRSVADTKSFVSFKGVRQGVVKGKSGREVDGWFEIRSFNWVDPLAGDVQLAPTRDPKRKPFPFKIQKQVDASSPYLLEAVNTRETMEVAVQILDGNSKVIRNIVLKNAVVKGIHKDDGESVTFEYTDMTDQP